MAPDPATPGGASDARLLEGCLRGDKKSWDTLVERYSKLIYWSIWKALGEGSVDGKHDHCRETFQEFFKRLIEPSTLQKLRGVTSLPKYLQVMAGRLALERFRRPGLEEIPENYESAAADPAKEAESAERRAILETVLGKLKPKERTCLELHYLDGHTHAEISVRLGLSQDTVSSILRRTKEKVKERLRRRGIDE